jgi:hypothetical protein
MVTSSLSFASTRPNLAHEADTSVRGVLTDSSQHMALARRICWTNFALRFGRRCELAENVPVVPRKGVCAGLLLEV